MLREMLACFVHLHGCLVAPLQQTLPAILADETSCGKHRVQQSLLREPREFIFSVFGPAGCNADNIFWIWLNQAKAPLKKIMAIVRNISAASTHQCSISPSAGSGKKV